MTDDARLCADARLALIQRSPTPVPWDEGDNIPWHAPDFSARMLQEHLSQAHDAASRRAFKIEQHVAWIHHSLLKGRATRILDLACGPGLYASRLARLGHRCVGIDYSPASIQYAVACAAEEQLDCAYTLQDIRQAEFGAGFGLVMLIFGELNIFRPAHARQILRQACQALDEDGWLLLEPHTLAAVRKIGERGRTWHSAETSVFSAQPHVCLEESCWDSASRTATVRYFILEASSGNVTRYAQTFQAYDDDEYCALLNEGGLDRVEFFPSLTGAPDETARELFALTARKPRPA